MCPSLGYLFPFRNGSSHERTQVRPVGREGIPLQHLALEDPLVVVSREGCTGLEI